MHKLYCWSLNVNSPGLPMCLIARNTTWSKWLIHAHNIHACRWSSLCTIRMGAVRGVVYLLGRGMWVWLLWSLKPLRPMHSGVRFWQQIYPTPSAFWAGLLTSLLATHCQEACHVASWLHHTIPVLYLNTMQSVWLQFMDIESALWQLPYPTHPFIIARALIYERTVVHIPGFRLGFFPWGAGEAP